MKKTPYIFIFIFLFSAFSLYAQEQTGELNCRIKNTDDFVKIMNGTETKVVSFVIIGIENKDDVSAFNAKVSGTARLNDIIFDKPVKGECQLTATFSADAWMNDFRLFLMAADVKNIYANDRTYEVLHLSVKKINPFE